MSCVHTAEFIDRHLIGSKPPTTTSTGTSAESNTTNEGITINESGYKTSRRLECFVQGVCRALIELNRNGHASVDQEAQEECRERCLEEWSGNTPSRLHLCLDCLYIGCLNIHPSRFSHMKQHSNATGHLLSLDTAYGSVYCVRCRDFQYNQLLEDLFRKFFAAQNFFPHGKFSEWEPPESTVKMIKKINNNSYDSIQPSDQNVSSRLFKLLKLKSSSIIGLRGLINLGNTCFMNCILQTLTHIPTLRDYFLSDQHYCSNENTNNNMCLICHLVVLFQEFYSGKRSPYIPFQLLHQVWTQVKHLAGYEQQDAHEFFIATLNAIHKNCVENDTYCILQNKDKSSFTNYNNCNCIIDRIFTGGLQSDVVCSNCNHISTTVDPFWDISLDIYKSAGETNGLNEPLKLEDCLQKFTLPELLTSFNCSNCKCSKEAKKQFTMKKLPIVCCFHLKRFEQSNRIHKKIFDHISFPEILDMSPFMSTNLTSSNNNPDETLVEKANDLDKFESNKYFLFAVVNHAGTLESGHYTSFVRLRSDQWFKCDDHVISRASLEEVMSSEGYLLFYHKIWHNYNSP